MSLFQEFKNRLSKDPRKIPLTLNKIPRNTSVIEIIVGEETKDMGIVPLPTPMGVRSGGCRWSCRG